MGAVRKRQNKKGTVYYVDFSVDGKRHRETVGPSRLEAEIVLRKMDEDVRKRRFPVLNVSKPRRKGRG